VTSSLISSIVSSNGVRLDFEYSDLLPMIINGSPETERRDLKNTYSLRRIKVSSSAGVVEKQIALNFDYHQSPGAPAAFAEGSHEYYRLLLESVTEEGKAPYQLFYNTTTPTQMPMRLSASVDKWGYFNGASNGNLLPQLDEILGLGIVSGANRDVNIDYNQALILNKIKYPTGGVSEFYYEPNYYDEVGLRLRPFLNPREVGVSSFGSSPVLSNTFNITNQPYTPAITFTSQGCSSNNQEIGSNCRVLLKNNTTGTPPIFYGASDGNILLVQNNNYTFSVLSDGCDCAAHLHWKEREDLWVNVNERHYVGGVRIGRVVGDPMDGNSSFEKSYFYTNPTTGHSSGHVQFEPSFTYNLTSHNNLLDDPQKPLRCDFLARVGASVVPLSYVQGNSIGYEYVTELIGVGGQGGKTVTRFKLMNDIGGVGAIPFTPVTSYEWLRGLMESETKYRYDPSDPINPFRQVSNVYHQYEVKHSLEEPNVANEQKIQGLKILQKSAEFWTPKNPLLLIPATFSYARYYNISAWYFRKKTIEQQNDSKTSDQFIERETNYYYLNPIHAQISKLENLTTGKKQIVSYTYPADYSLVSTGVLASMKSDERNMHGIPIEKITSQWVDGRGEEIVSGQFTSYDFIGYDNPITPEDERLILPVKLESTELSAVKPKNDFISSLLSGEAADNSYSIRQEVTYYPNTGNVKEILSIKNPPSTLLWGYANSQIVAEVRNATYEQVKNALGGESVVNDVAQNATLSPTQIALLNGLRQNPLLSKSLITTYTHDPLAGILTKTDANGQTLYYNYDDAGRIKEIRDSYQDLIKLYKYHYKD
jgi:YD repeat-containing protein